jgi:CHASE3 domain sensor protein
MQNTEMHDIEMDLKEQMATADENFRKREEEFQELDEEQRVKIE